MNSAFLRLGFLWVTSLSLKKCPCPSPPSKRALIQKKDKGYDFGVHLGTFGENLHGDNSQIYQQISWIGTDKEENTKTSRTDIL